MQFLHCSDLHIGKRVNEFSMIPEQQLILGQIVEIAASKPVDGVLIAGDIYDKAVPSVEAVQLFDQFLTDLAEREIPVYLISGNHDSPERLSFGSRLLEQRGVHLTTAFDGVLHPLTLTDDHGPLYLYGMPFLKPAMVRPFYPESAIESYEDAVKIVLAHSRIDPSARNVLMAHQFVTSSGREPERCDSETLSIGGVDQVDASLFAGFDYVALGHLHGPQWVGRETVRYCGSPLKYSFSEWRQRKSVTLVTLQEKGDVSLELVPLKAQRDLREIRGKLEALLDPEVVAGGNREDYLRVILTDEEPPYDPMGRLRQVYPNIMRLDVENSRTRQGEPSVTAAERVEAQSPLELFASFYEMANGTAMTAEEQAILESLLAEMAGEAQ